MDRQRALWGRLFDVVDDYLKEEGRNEHAADRVAAGVGGRARGAAGQGEGADPRSRRACRRTPPDAEDGGREGLRVRGPGRAGEPARPVRRAPSADRLPLLLRARRRRLARGGLPRLLDGRRPGRPPRPSERPRHHARLRLARPAGGHRALEGADGLGAHPLVHADGRLRRRLRRRRVARHQRLLPRRRRPDLPHVLRRRAAATR